MHWSNTILSGWYPSKLSFRQHKITGIFCRLMRLFWCLSECYVSLPKVAGCLSQPTTVSCVTNCYAVCDSDTSFTFIIPSSWATVLSVSFVSPPLRTSEGSFSFCTCSLLPQRLALKDQTLLLSHYHFYRPLTTRYCFGHPLFLSPFLIPTSSSQLTYLHCSSNSKLYSMLSTCPSVTPISIPPILSTYTFLPRFLTPGRITVRLRGGGETRWPPTSQNCQTWFPPVVHLHGNQTN